MLLNWHSLPICLWLVKLVNGSNVADVPDCLKSPDSALLCFENVVKSPKKSDYVITSNGTKVLSEQFDEIMNRPNYVTHIGNALVTITKTEPGGVNLQMKLSNSTAVAERKMKMKMNDFLPYLIAPAFFLAGIMPWIIPKLKMAVFLVGLINNIAFSQALYALVRNYVFNSAKDEHIIYLNHGYKYKNEHLKRLPPITYNHVWLSLITSRNCT